MKVNKKKLAPMVYNDIEIREATVGENIEAARIAGEERGLKFVCALLAITATFDGKQLHMEDILNFPESFFFGTLAKQCRTSHQGIEGAKGLVLAMMKFGFSYTEIKAMTMSEWMMWMSEISSTLKNE